MSMLFVLFGNRVITDRRMRRWVATYEQFSIGQEAASPEL